MRVLHVALTRVAKTEKRETRAGNRERSFVGQLSFSLAQSGSFGFFSFLVALFSLLKLCDAV
jgi:hypothetical protein